MPHIHGVAWIDRDFLAEMNIEGDLKDNPVAAVELAEKILSYSTSSDDAMVNEIAQEVQKHKHTKSCKKYGTNCRYGFPRLPSSKTILAKPLPDDMDPTERKAILESAKQLLGAAKDLLESEDLNEDMSFEEFLKALNTTEKEYHNAIGTMAKGYQLVLKRSVKDRYINTFCPEWLKVWDANTDVQLALDPYAIITYVVNYVSKDETGMTQCLKEALQGKANEPVRERLNTLKLAYLKNRQMGASEAVYRFFPMKLKNSNVATNFVQTGFIENRTFFFKKVCDDEDISDNEQESEGEVEDEEEFTQCSSNKTVRIKDKAGKFTMGNPIHER